MEGNGKPLLRGKNKQTFPLPGMAKAMSSAPRIMVKSPLIMVEAPSDKTIA